ncbi:ATP-binding protein [Candidatus Riflebacteria bacterium]
MHLLSSLRARIIFNITVLLIIISIVTAMLSFARETRAQRNFILARAQTLGTTLAEIISTTEDTEKLLARVVNAAGKTSNVSWIKITNPSFHCIYSTNSSFKGKDFHNSYKNFLPFFKENHPFFIIQRDQSHQEFIFPLKSKNFPLGYMIFNVFLPEYSIKTQVREWPIILTSLLILFLGFFLAIIISQFILNPIEKLTSAARRMAEGDFDTLVELEGDEKLKNLADTFNFMADQIRTFLSQLQEKNILLENNYKEVTDLYRIATQVTSSLDVPRTTQGFLESLQETLEADYCYLKWNNPTKGIPGGYFSSTVHGDELEKQSKDLHEILKLVKDKIHSVMQERAPYHYLFVPLFAALKPLGFIIVSRAEKPFKPEELRFIKTLSPQFSQTLLNLSLYSETKYMSDYITNTINSLSEGVITIEQNFQVTIANGAFFQIIGIETEKTFPIPLDNILKEIRNSKLRAKLKKLFLDYPMPRDKVEIKLDLKKGKYKIITCEFFPLLTRAAEFQGKVFVIDDITEKKHLEEEMIQHEKLLTLGRMAASINHEIGNAITPIKTLTGVIRGKSDDKDTNKFLDVILKELDRLEQLLSSLKQFSKKIVIEPEKVMLAPFFERLQLLMERELKEQNINLEFKSPKQLSWYFDPVKIQQTLINLISNSVDSLIETETLNPEVKIHAQCIFSGQLLRINVTDNGQGIKTEQYEEIFEAFYTTKTKGTGLGLALCKQVVHLHGGRIHHVEDNQCGAHFMIDLPRRSFQSDISSKSLKNRR